MIRTISTFANTASSNLKLKGRAMSTIGNPYWMLPRSLADHHRAAMENLTCNPALLKPSQDPAIASMGEANVEVFKLYESYKSLGMPFGDPIYSVKGESWNAVAPALQKHVQDFKPTIADFGYGEHAFGVQRHRDIAKDLITHENNLADLNLSDDDFQVGTWSMSTRLAMFDLGRLIQKKRLASGMTKTPVVVVPSPAWDYAGIYEELGFKMLYLPLEKEDGFQPNLNTWEEALWELDVTKEEVALVVVNAQHNPTGIQFTPDDVQYLFNIVKNYDSSHLLIDDAYFAVHDPCVPVTNTLKIWLKQVDERYQERWLCTRPFSKQLGCNAIPFAAISGSGKMLKALNDLAWNHSYMTGKLTSEIMTQFVQTDEYKEHTLFTGQELLRRKQMIKQFFVERLGYPCNSSVVAGPSSYYMLFELPPAWLMDGISTQDNNETITHFRDQLFLASGVMLSATLFNRDTKLPYVRIHMGGQTDIITDMLHRFEDCGLRWDMIASFPSNTSRVMFRTLLEEPSSDLETVLPSDEVELMEAV